jgi:hypothetical protein
MLLKKYFFLSGKPFDLFFQQQMEGLNEQTAERGVLLERARQVSTHPTRLFTHVQRRCPDKLRIWRIFLKLIALLGGHLVLWLVGAN